MEYVKAFLCGGILCVIGQVLIDKTPLTPAKILVAYVTAGVILSGAGVYQYLVDWGGAGAPSRLRPSAGQGGQEGGFRGRPDRRPHRRLHCRGGRDHGSDFLRVYDRSHLQAQTQDVRITASP